MKRLLATVRVKILTSTFIFLAVIGGTMGRAFASPNNDCPAVANTACIDSTTGYGPVVLIFNGSGNLAWSTVAPACSYNVGDVYGEYDTPSLVIYGASVVFEVSAGQPTCNSTVVSHVYFTQYQMDYFRWYGNAYGVNHVYYRN